MYFIQMRVRKTTRGFTNTVFRRYQNLMTWFLIPDYLEKNFIQTLICMK